MIQDYIDKDFIDMDTQQKVRYVSESSNASTSGCSTMSPGTGSSGFSMPPSPAQSPASVLQAEFSNLNMPSAVSPQYQQRQSPLYTQLQSSQIGLTNNVENLVLQQPFAGTAAQSRTPFSVKNEYPAELHINEQPVEKFRFRYKSEMHGTHGSLNGASSQRTPKTFPEVELRNWNGNAVIRCSLFQTNLKSPHSHQLVVRKDDVDICDPHDLHVSPEQGYIAKFQNMGIIHTAKKFIVEELLKKKRKRLLFELGRDELTTREDQELHKQTEKEAKDMNLNQVRLCFEAFQVEENNIWTPIAAPVFTNPINNRKSAQTGELRICRLSIVSGSVSGGEDLILLVEKVSKKNIKVRFYEMRDEDELVWEAFAQFRESDVHHQYAIVCRTPPYKDKDIDKPVEVYIELVRPSDDERSYPPATFRYKPRDVVVSRKRRRTCSSAANSSGSNSSISSLELPKTVQEQTAVLNANNAMPVGTFTTSSANSMPHDMTISEEFKDVINDLVQDPGFRDNVLNSEELNQIYSQNFTEFGMLNILEPQGLVTQGGGGGGGGRIERDGTSKLSGPLHPNILHFKKLMLAGSHRNPYLQRILKIFYDTRTEKPSETMFASAAEQISKIFGEHQENNENGYTLVHEIVANDNAKMAIQICHILNYFKLNQLLNNATNVRGQTGLHCACLYDRPHYIRPLLSLGCDPNIQDFSGNTALHIAVQEQHLKCIESLLNANTGNGLSVDLSILNDDGLTPLHMAIRNNQYDVAKKLVQHNKASVAVANSKERNNALHMAVQQQNLKLVQLMLDSQNNNILTAHNAAGLTPLVLAKQMASSGEAGADILTHLMSYYNEAKVVPMSVNASNSCDSDSEFDSKLVIKEEEVSSSSAEDDEENEPMTDLKEESLDIPIKEERSETREDKEENCDVPIETAALENALDNDHKFKELTKLLSIDDKWKRLAEKLKIQHFFLSSAEGMLNTIKRSSSIDNQQFVAALVDLDKEALRILTDNN